MINLSVVLHCWLVPLIVNWNDWCIIRTELFETINETATKVAENHSEHEQPPVMDPASAIMLPFGDQRHLHAAPEPPAPQYASMNG